MQRLWGRSFAHLLGKEQGGLCLDFAAEVDSEGVNSWRFSASIFAWLLCVCLLLFSLIRMLAIRAHPDNPGWSHLKNFNLITSAKTIFPNKATFIGSWITTWTWPFGGHHSTHHTFLAHSFTFFKYFIGRCHLRVQSPSILLKVETFLPLSTSLLNLTP